MSWKPQVRSETRKSFDTSVNQSPMPRQMIFGITFRMCVFLGLPSMASIDQRADCGYRRFLYEHTNRLGNNASKANQRARASKNSSTLLRCQCPGRCVQMPLH